MYIQCRVERGRSNWGGKGWGGNTTAVGFGVCALADFVCLPARSIPGPAGLSLCGRATVSGVPVEANKQGHLGCGESVTSSRSFRGWGGESTKAYKDKNGGGWGFSSLCVYSETTQASGME